MKASKEGIIDAVFDFNIAKTAWLAQATIDLEQFARYVDFVSEASRNLFLSQMSCQYKDGKIIFTQKETGYKKLDTYFNEQINDLQEEINETVSGYCSDLYAELKNGYNFLMSEDNVYNYINSGEYRFLEDGTLIDE